MSARAAKILILLLALLVLTLLIDAIPGMHGDEAWTLLRAREIAAGARPITGMNSYTGALFQYLCTPFLKSTGYSLQVLRCISAVMNIAALALIIAATGALRNTPGGSPGTDLRIGLLVASSPVFIAFSRFAVELTALTPLLVAGAAYLMARSIKGPPRGSRWKAAGAGLLLAFAAYNHIVNLCVCAAAAIAAVAAFGPKSLRDRRVHAALGTFVIAYLPLLALTQHQPEIIGPATRDHWRAFATGSFLDDFPDLPRVLNGIWNGQLIYLRFTGENLLPVIPYASVIAAALITLRAALRKKWPIDRVAWFLLLTAAGNAVLVAVVAPALSERYFEIAALFALAGVGWWAGPLFAAHERKFRRIGAAGLACFVALNLGYVGIDYFKAFADSGGQIAVFPLGKRVLETSDCFISKDSLIAQLQADAVRTVLTDNLTGWVLLANEADHPFYRVMGFETPHLLPPGGARLFRGKTAIVFLNGLNPIGQAVIEPPSEDEIRLGPLKFRRNPAYDPRFLVYEGLTPMSEPGHDHHQPEPR